MTILFLKAKGDDAPVGSTPEAAHLTVVLPIGVYRQLSYHIGVPKEPLSKN
ncbi:hypothetical protein [Paraburkholderia fungorum]|uniref:hypothetical protein n=1 Tax=Paraburkholderia fungorum TaxID=134537 RepID=UPI0038BD1272